MASWTNFGANDVSEEVQAYKDKLASKDGHIAAQQSQLMRQREELDEIRIALKESQYKLDSELGRVVKLEEDLKTRSNELRDEKIASQNASQALAAAQETIREKTIEARDLEAHLERLSRTNGDQSSQSERLQQDKRLLEARIRELQDELAQATTQPKPPITRPRSSSLFEARDNALQQDMAQIRASLDAKNVELTVASDRASLAQAELLKLENEKAASERKFTKEISSLQSQLEEKEAEIEYLQAQGMDGSREQELMRRIEEDEAKIAALEKLASEGHDGRRLKASLRQVEEDLSSQRSRVSTLESRLALSDGEKAYVQDQLEHAEGEVARLKDVLSAQASEIGRLRNELAVKTEDQMDIDKPHSTSRALSPDTQEAVASHVQRLLDAVERLRGERDSLRRNVQFLESEHQFAVKALESEIASLSQSKEEQADSTIARLRNDLELAQTRSAGRKDVIRSELRRMGRVATASLVMVQNFAFYAEQLRDQFPEPQTPQINLSRDLAQSHQRSVELETKTRELKNQLEECIFSVESVTKERDGILTRLQDVERASLSDSMSGRETVQRLRNDLERAQCEVQQFSKALESVESERSSLYLQVTNLTEDLKKAQDELAQAETRYADLQFHQLSSMSTSEVNASLRERVKELEGRVLRRTEQIGIHQHDIRRMETNLKLQEERLTELAAELEMMVAQKDAMVEDCADAREARDNAIARLDAMEVEMEGKIEEGERTVETLVQVIIQTISTAKERFMKSDEDVRSSKEELARLEEDYRGALELLEEKEAVLKASQLEDVQQSTLALAVSQSGLRKALAYIREILEQKITLRQEIAAQRSLVQQEQTRNELLKLQLSELQDELETSEAAHAEQLAELQATISSLDNTVLEHEKAHQLAMGQMQNANNALQATLDQTQQLLEKNNDDRMAELQARYEHESANIRQSLADTDGEAARLREELDITKSKLEASLADATTARSDLEEQIAKLTNLLQNETDQHHEVRKAKEEALAEKRDLQQALDDATASMEEKQVALDELQHSYEQINTEMLQTRHQQESSLSSLTAASEQARQQLESEISGLKTRIDQYRQQVDTAEDEAKQLSNQIEVQASQHREESAEHKAQLCSTQECLRIAEDGLRQAQRDLETAQAEMAKLHEQMASLEQERTALQEQATTLEAENQRSISLQRYLENQIKESERKSASLTDELEQTRAQLLAADQATRTAEANLSLQSAQFKRESAELQKQLANLQSQPDLQIALAELEERNNEMEELLRKKCVEIEENDDRVLEMLKDNKKLTTKVESLTRKVQNLQTKLSAAKAALPKSAEPTNTVAPVPVLSPPAAQLPAATKPHLLSSVRGSTSPPVPTTSRPTIQRLSLASSSMQIRSQTPEQNPAPPPVFKARTPERPSIHPIAAEAMAMATAPSSSSVGKKRRAPDDDELEDKRLPAQVFTADSLPSQEHRSGHTPRVRRVLNGLQSGFTPKRNHNRHAASPSPRKPSPKKFAFASASGVPQHSSVIHDVTNSPRGTVNAGSQSTKEKRSWLNKIRGNATQPAPGRTNEARPRFDREIS